MKTVAELSKAMRRLGSEKMSPEKLAAIKAGMDRGLPPGGAVVDLHGDLDSPTEGAETGTQRGKVKCYV